MADKITTLKPVAKKKDKTFKEMLNRLVDDIENPEEELSDTSYQVGMIVLSTEAGLKMIPLKDNSYMEYIGLLELAKSALIENLYEY